METRLLHQPHWMIAIQLFLSWSPQLCSLFGMIVCHLHVMLRWWSRTEMKKFPQEVSESIEWARGQRGPRPASASPQHRWEQTTRQPLKVSSATHMYVDLSAQHRRSCTRIAFLNLTLRYIEKKFDLTYVIKLRAYSKKHMAFYFVYMLLRPLQLNM